MTTELNNKLVSLQGFLGNTADLAVFKDVQKDAMVLAGAPAVPAHEFETIDNNSKCVIVADGYNSDLQMYEMDLQLRMYVMDQLS